MYEWVNSLVLATAVIEVRQVKDWADIVVKLEEDLAEAQERQRPMQPIERSYVPR